MEQLYRCEYCKDYTGSEKEVAEHEDNCKYNPKYKGCLSCKYALVAQRAVLCTKYVLDKNNSVLLNAKILSKDDAYKEHSCYEKGTPRKISDEEWVL